MPAGFEAITIGSTFATHSARFFGRWHDGRLEIGFHVEPHQVNPGLNCHGGMLCTFADVVLAAAAHYQHGEGREYLFTISLQTDFLDTAALGSWVQGEAEILKRTRKLVFTQGLIRANGKLVARISAVFRRGPVQVDTDEDAALVLPGMPVPRASG